MLSHNSKMFGKTQSNSEEPEVKKHEEEAGQESGHKSTNQRRVEADT